MAPVRLRTRLGFKIMGKAFVISPILGKINGQSQLYTIMITDLDFELQFQQQGTLNVPTFIPSKETLDVDEQESEG